MITSFSNLLVPNHRRPDRRHPCQHHLNQGHQGLFLAQLPGRRPKPKGKRNEFYKLVAQLDISEQNYESQRINKSIIFSMFLVFSNRYTCK